MDYQNYKVYSRQVFDEINKLRRLPASFISDLEYMIRHFEGKVLKYPGKTGLITEEGPQAARDCIAYLNSISNQHLNSLIWSNELEKAAQKFVYDIGDNGIISHTGSNGERMGDRISNEGDWSGKIAENIDFGEKAPREVVVQFLVDDGNPSRGHRKSLFDPEFKNIGIAAAKHKTERQCCVMDFASSIEPKGQKQFKELQTQVEIHKNNDILVQQVFQEINRIRTNPQSLIPELKEKIQYFEGDLFKYPGKMPLRTKEGEYALKDCIDHLLKQHPVRELELEKGLCTAARDHAYDIGTIGECSHTGSDGSTMSKRIEKYGKWMGKAGETIDFGNSDPQDIVMSLIIDDGDLGRGHRKSILSEDFRKIGIAIYSHKTYKYCCVMDFVSEFKSSEQLSQTVNESQKRSSFNPNSLGVNFPIQQGKSSYSNPSDVNQFPFSQQHNFDFKDIGNSLPNQQHQFGNDQQGQLPPGCVSRNTKTNVKTEIHGNEKHITTTTVTEDIMKDGSKQINTQTNTKVEFT